MEREIFCGSFVLVGEAHPYYTLLIVKKSIHFNGISLTKTLPQKLETH